ncbi:MAG: transposase [Bryobacterales bacterium]|nr:transposase [Bryobacterales bacterium]
MAARLDPTRVQPMRQSPHHLVARAPWGDEEVLDQARSQFSRPWNAEHSVGVARQYRGQVGEQDNCRVGEPVVGGLEFEFAHRVSLVSSQGMGRRCRAPEKDRSPGRGSVEFQTKPEIALDQIRAAVTSEVTRRVVLADAAYGINTAFREGLTELELQYAVGLQSTMTVWESGQQPLPAKQRGATGRPPNCCNAATGINPSQSSNWRLDFRALSTSWQHALVVEC